MRHLRSVSVLLVVVGLVLLAAASLLDLQPTWALIGALLVVAGIVKVVVVVLWRGLATSDPATTGADE